MSEPWAVHGEPASGGFGWELQGMAPGWLARMRRDEALERHAAEREAAERRERAEERREVWLWNRAQELAARGVPFDLSRPATLAESVEEMSEKIFAAQDRDARRAEFAAAREAGLVHLLSVDAREMAAGQTVLEPAGEVEDRAIRTELLQARRRTVLEGIRANARRALKHIGGRG